VPEGLEAELYRRGADRALGRKITDVFVDGRQEWSRELGTLLSGASFTAARRIGKLLLLDVDQSTGAHTLGVHFGMTGRLVVDGLAPIDSLEYSSARDDSSWDRLCLSFEDGGTLRVNDPRRWARFVPDPTTESLGPDFLDVSADHLVGEFARRRRAVKAVLLDQAVVAGYGNMSVDEMLWQAGLSPVVPAREIPVAAIERFVGLARPQLLGMLDRGGSHRGVIDPQVRAAVPPCPRDGAPMRRESVSGRTTIWCPHHQTDGRAG
jgi:formamidopyrimidine-DNA glycosylase